MSCIHSSKRTSFQHAGAQLVGAQELRPTSPVRLQAQSCPEFSASRGHRAARQLGGGWMVSQTANPLRGTRARIHVWIPSVSVHFVFESCLSRVVHSQLKACRAFTAQSVSCIHSSKRTSFQHAGSRERGRGDIVRSLEAGGWCRRWQALCEVPVRAHTCGFPVSLCSLSLHFVCALWLLPYGMIP